MIAFLHAYPAWYAAFGAGAIAVVVAGKTLYDQRQRNRRSVKRLDSLIQNNALKGFEKREQ